MARKFADCIKESIKAGHITQKEGEQTLSWYNHIRSTGADDAKAKTEVGKQLEMEAKERERRSLKTAGRIKGLQDEVTSFRSVSGSTDMPMAWQMLHDRRGDEGKFGASQDGIFGLSLKELEDAIVSEVTREIESVSHEFRRGILLGDMKIQSKAMAKVFPGVAKTQARLSEVTKAMRGEKTSDPYAQQLADMLMGVAEKVRLRFNEAGGAIGKLDGWGGPQHHNQEAVHRAGREAWIEFILPKLDRDKMVHSLTKRKLSDGELRESLEVSWERITTNGFVDEEKISGVPVGKGALWSQHADHRFLHFKSAEDWMAYAKEYGNSNPYISFMNWLQVMVRDIAAMEKFGPNPTMSRGYMKEWIKAKSLQVKPNETIIKEQKAKLKELTGPLSQDNPEYTKLSAELDQILSDIEQARSHPAWTAGGFITTALGMKGQAAEIMAQWTKKLDDLYVRMTEVQAKLTDTPKTLDNQMAEKAYRDLLDEMRNPIRFANTDNPAGYAANSLRFTDSIWEFQRGALSTPINSKTANVMATLRNVVTSTALNSAILSAITDTAFQSVRRGFLGMSAAKANPLTVLIETLKTIRTDDKRYAVRSGLILDSALHAWQKEAENSTRWAKARSVTGFVADRVISLQGLNAWTQAGKHIFGMELMGHLADESTKTWKDMSPDLREALERAGFDAKGWDTIRKAKLDEPKPGATFLRPNEIADVSPELAQRYIAMILRETRYAIIEPTPTVKALMLGGTRPGTVAGEAVRGMGQLKTFPLTVMAMHGGQTASLLKGGDPAGSARYAGAILITGTLMGALAMTLKDINAGRDPRKWLEEETYLDPNFWGAAILQSGGLGIYGDFLFSQVNRQGGGWAKTLAGPLVERLESVWNLTGGNAMDLAQNAVRGAKGEPTKPTRFGRELSKFLRQNVPTVVWNKLIMERMVHDQLQKWLDPEAPQAFQQQRLSRKKDFGQDFFYAPGEMYPSRAPDLTRMFATRK